MLDLARLAGGIEILKLQRIVLERFPNRNLKPTGSE